MSGFSSFGEGFFGAAGNTMSSIIANNMLQKRQQQQMLDKLILNNLISGKTDVSLGSSFNPVQAQLPIDQSLMAGTLGLGLSPSVAGASTDLTKSFMQPPAVAAATMEQNTARTLEAMGLSPNATQLGGISNLIKKNSMQELLDKQMKMGERIQKQKQAKLTERETTLDIEKKLREKEKALKELNDPSTKGTWMSEETFNEIEKENPDRSYNVKMGDKEGQVFVTGFSSRKPTDPTSMVTKQVAKDMSEKLSQTALYGGYYILDKDGNAVLKPTTEAKEIADIKSKVLAFNNPTEITGAIKAVGKNSKLGKELTGFLSELDSMTPKERATKQAIELNKRINKEGATEEEKEIAREEFLKLKQLQGQFNGK